MKCFYEKIFSFKFLGIQLTMRWGNFFLNEQKKKFDLVFVILNLLKIVCVLFLERKLVLEENLDTCIPALDTSIGAKD